MEQQKETYRQENLPKEEVERLKTIEYPNFVSETILNRFDLKEKTLLDAGAGSNSELGRYIAERGGRYVPLDLRHDMLKNMKTGFEKESAPFYGIQADVQRLPFKDGGFDIAHERFVLMNVPAESRKGVFDEMKRVTKGKVILIEYDWKALQSTEYAAIIDRFRNAALKFFSYTKTDPYLGGDMEKILKEFDPSLRFEVDIFERPEELANTQELILNCGSFAAVTQNLFHDNELAIEFINLQKGLERSPITFRPPNVVAVTVHK